MALALGGRPYLRVLVEPARHPVVGLHLLTEATGIRPLGFMRDRCDEPRASEIAPGNHAQRCGHVGPVVSKESTIGAVVLCSLRAPTVTVGVSCSRWGGTGGTAFSGQASSEVDLVSASRRRAPRSTRGRFPETENDTNVRMSPGPVR